MALGLVPHWATDIKVGFANINAKGEGIETRPAFREAFQRRRCLVPVDNFYEWQKTTPGKQPSVIALADRGLMALLVPYPAEGMTCWPISRRVNSVRNNDASLIEAVAA